MVGFYYFAHVLWDYVDQYQNGQRMKSLEKN